MEVLVLLFTLAFLQNQKGKKHKHIQSERERESEREGVNEMNSLEESEIYLRPQ